MTDEIKVNSGQEVGVSEPSKRIPKVGPKKEEEEKQDKNIVTWQFKKRRYHEVTNLVDKIGDKTRSGNPVKRTVKVRNWRMDLDLTKPEDKELHEYLLKHKDINNYYYLLTDKERGDKASEEGETLRKLMDMSIPQLMGCINDEELHEIGLTSANLDKYQLVAAIMRKKKLV